MDNTTKLIQNRIKKFKKANKEAIDGRRWVQSSVLEGKIMELKYVLTLIKK